ncbi:MAG: hypothetical protein LIP01_04110 [Tannerellaceae bacterium]|nr:hypothetical protein [Tannerellaceae bacterium]
MKKDTTFLYLCFLISFFLFACNNPKTNQQEIIPAELLTETPLETVEMVEEEEEEEPKEEYQPEEPDWESIELEAPNPEDIIAYSVNQVVSFANKEEHFTQLKDQHKRNLKKYTCYTLISTMKTFRN